MFREERKRFVMASHKWYLSLLPSIAFRYILYQPTLMYESRQFIILRGTFYLFIHFFGGEEAIKRHRNKWVHELNVRVTRNLDNRMENSYQNELQTLLVI